MPRCRNWFTMLPGQQHNSGPSPTYSALNLQQGTRTTCFFELGLKLQRRVHVLQGGRFAAEGLREHLENGCGPISGEPLPCQGEEPTCKICTLLCTVQHACIPRDILGPFRPNQPTMYTVSLGMRNPQGKTGATHPGLTHSCTD